MDRLKKQKIMIFKDFLVVQMNHWVFFTIVITLLGLLGESRPDILRWGFFSFFPFFLFWVRQIYNKFLPFTVLHMILAIGMFLILSPEGVMNVIFIICISGYVIYSYFLRVKTENGIDNVIKPPIVVGMVAGMFLMQSFLGQPEWSGYYVFVIIAFLGMYFICYFIENYEYFLEINEGSTGRIPEREIFHSGMGLAVIYAVFSFAVLILAANFNRFYQIMSKFIIDLTLGLVRGILRFLLWLLNLFGVGGDLIVEDEEVIEQFPPSMEPMEPEKPFWLWEVLEKIMVTAVCCLLIAAVILSIIKLVQFLRERFGRKLKKQAVGIYNAEDVREKCEIEKKKSEKKGFFTFLSSRERIRRIYKKRVLEGKEELIGERDSSMLNSFTARECGRRLEAEGLADIYEKARYSDGECTADDVKKARV